MSAHPAIGYLIEFAVRIMIIIFGCVLLKQITKLKYRKLNAQTVKAC